MDSSRNGHFLDGPVARLVALACFVLSAAVLTYVHRDDLFAKPAEPVAGKDNAFSRCFRDGTTPIDAMLAEHTIGEEDARLFRLRAEARCRAQTGNAGGPPASRAPGLPPVR